MEVGRVVLLGALVAAGRACQDKAYLSNAELLTRMDALALGNPDLVSTYTIGVSTRQVELRVLNLSAAPEDADLPKVKLVGGIHGDEPPSTHVLINFAEHMVRAYRYGDRFATWILNNTRIHILPRLNPDGYSQAIEGECTLGPGRRNAAGKDLNRQFPTADEDDGGLMEPEVEAVVRWSETEKFTLGAGLHSGALVAVYPLDSPLGASQMDLLEYIEQLDLEALMNESEENSTEVNAFGEDMKGTTPDEDVFQHLAKTYAKFHSTMAKGIGCGANHFPEGFINGAEWYQAPGSMMDYNYLYAGTMELTLELYCCKYPAPRFLCYIWEENRLALMKLVAEAVRGVRGTVSSNGIPLENATVKVLDRDMPVFTNSKGRFYRVLLPGRYFLEVEMIGMKPRIVEVEVFHQGTALFTWTEIDVDLVPEGPDISEVQPTGTPLYDRGGLDPEGTTVHNVYSTSNDWWTTGEGTESDIYNVTGRYSYINKSLISTNQSYVLTSKLLFSNAPQIIINKFSLFIFAVLLFCN